MAPETKMRNCLWCCFGLLRTAQNCLKSVDLLCQDVGLFVLVTKTAAVFRFDWKLMAIYHPEIKQEMVWCGNEQLNS